MASVQPLGASPVLEAIGVSAFYGKNRVLTDVSVQLLPAEVLCVVGHNGAGKSSLLRILYGLIPIKGGHVHLRGAPIVPNSHLMASKGVNYVPEGRGIFPSLTVEENFRLALWSAGLRDQTARERVDEVTTILPSITGFWTRKAGQLSGGQQQMVSVGRALLSRPQILLLDEPSIGLSPKTFEDLIRPLRHFQQQRGMSIILVEQNTGEAFLASDRVLVMKSGSVIFRGIPDDFVDRQKLMDLY